MEPLTREHFTAPPIRNFYTQVGRGPIVAHSKGHVMSTYDLTDKLRDPDDSLRQYLRAAREHALTNRRTYAVVAVPNNYGERASAAVWAPDEAGLETFAADALAGRLTPLELAPVPAPYEELGPDAQWAWRMREGMRSKS